MIVFLFIGLCFAHTIPRSVVPVPPLPAGGQRENCNATDRIIYTKRGHTFAQVFRSFGGFSVSKSAYQKAIVDFMHLSPTCAECYSTAYICGWDHCVVKCAMAGPRCDKCLEKAGCIDACNKCTKFY
jgi:hypothetical protein